MNWKALLLGVVVVSVVGCGGGGGSNDLHEAPPNRADSAAIDRVVGLRPMLGLAFKPAPSDYTGTGSGKYEDSDFCNDDFRELWGPSGRDDIGKLRTAGVGFIHPYDWNQPGSGRNHKNFLNYCAANKVCVAVPISNYYITEMKNGNPNVQGWIDAIVGEVYVGGKRNPAVILWTLGNEWDNTGGFFQPGDIAQMAKRVIDAEDKLGIAPADRVAFTSPVTFGIKFGNPVEGAGATLQLRDAFTAAGMESVFKNRFIACVNSFNPGSDLGPWASTRFPGATENMPFIMYEVGKEIGADVQTEEQQGAFYAAQMAALLPLTRSGSFIGMSVFSNVNEFWKGGTEATFGVYKIATPNAKQGTTTRGEKYPIDTLAEKPSFAAMKQAYTATAAGQ